jgi:hypothetical protein
MRTMIIKVKSDSNNNEMVGTLSEGCPVLKEELYNSKPPNLNCTFHV